MARADEVVRRKLDFVDECVVHSGDVISMLILMEDSHRLYFNLGLQIGGANELTDLNLEPYYSFLAGDVVNIVTTYQQFSNFLRNVVVVATAAGQFNEQIRNNTVVQNTESITDAIERSKVDYCNGLINPISEQYTKVICDAQDLDRQWVKRSYSGAITDGDLADYRFVSADVTGYMNFITQLLNFDNAVAPPQGDYLTIVEKLRDISK